jgi:hypothetical protein
MRIFPIVFLIVVFVSVLLVSEFVYKKEPMHTQNAVADESNVNKCPSILIKKGNEMILYDDNKNQINSFSSLDEYIDYLKNERARGIDCPVLFIQSENDAQGNDVYRIRPDIFNQEGGTLPVTVAPVIDASRDSKIYNVNNYPGFDPNGLQIGVYSKLDAIHDSTENSKISDNPMDLNWGGVEFTQKSVDSGKYEDNEVTRPSYFHPTVQFFPDLHTEYKNPKSYVSSDLSF